MHLMYCVTAENETILYNNKHQKATECIKVVMKGIG